MGGILGSPRTGGRRKKNIRPSSRPGGTALILLRALQIGLSLADLDLITAGMLFDIITERKNDDYDWPDEATMADIENF